MKKTFFGNGVAFTSYADDLIAGFRKEAQKRALQCAHAVRNHAVRGMTGTKTGRRYKVKGQNVWYNASRPGEYPARPTGRLATSIRVVAQENLSMAGGATFAGLVGTNLLYGVYLEMGTVNMKARPWLSMALFAAQPDIQAILSKKWEVI